MAPILHVANARASIEWYAKLGFRVESEHVFGPDWPLYVRLRRGPAQLHLSEHRLDGGAVTPECARRAATVIGRLTDVVYLVSSPDAAEATKLYENIFRAVSLALANEFADACGTLSLDPVEVTLAAGTKPYGFLGALPGPGVGGHCIPCDPHYLLWQLGRDGHRSPLIE